MDRPVTRFNGSFKWVALAVSLGIAGLTGFFTLKGDVQALEARVDTQYETILRELDTIKEMVR